MIVYLSNLDQEFKHVYTVKSIESIVINNVIIEIFYLKSSLLWLNKWCHMLCQFFDLRKNN